MNPDLKKELYNLYSQLIEIQKDINYIYIYKFNRINNSFKYNNLVTKKRNLFNKINRIRIKYWYFEYNIPKKELKKISVQDLNNYFNYKKY